jgi:hypothetical protein
MCDYVIVANNNKYCASSSCGSNGISYGCATSGTITITTQSGVEYSVNGTAYQSSNSFAGLAPGYTLYVRNLAEVVC